MGLGESKEFNQELAQFPSEEKEILNNTFLQLSSGNKKIDRPTVEVCISFTCIFS